MTGSVLSSRRSIAPKGLQGGGNGQKGVNYIIRENGDREDIGSQMTLEMNVGDVFVIETPGGGGFGKQK